LRRHRPASTSRKSTAAATPLAKDRKSALCMPFPRALKLDIGAEMVRKLLTMPP
jgi:hypothetical protein